MKNTITNFFSSNNIVKILFFITSLYLIIGNIIVAETFSNDSELIIDPKLESVLEKINTLIIGNENKVILVSGIVNQETRKKDHRADLLEEKLTSLIYEKNPNQVVSYLEIQYLRQEWKRRFTDIRHDPSSEDIIKLTNADWLLTGTYRVNEGITEVNLNLFDLENTHLLWETVIYNKIISDDKKAGSFPEEILRNDFNQNSEKLPYFYRQQLHSPHFTEVSNLPPLDQNREDKKEESRLNLFSYFSEEKSIIIPSSMVKIPAGEFFMGSNSGKDDELPDHLVFIRSFYIDKHEVTNEDYKKCILCERGQGGFDTLDPQQPAVYIDWKNADTYCKSLNKRLPTEAEWEYTARAGNQGDYSFGDNISLLEDYAWLKTNTIDLGFWGAKKVSSKNPNKWGVYDLHGNVMEWVQNYYKDDYFSSVRQPNNPRGPKEPIDENYPLRVVRGGSWGGLYDSSTPFGLRSAKRFAFVEWTRSFQIGFRCVKDILDKNQK